MQAKKSEIDLASECISFLRLEYPNIQIYQEVSTRSRVVDIVCDIDGLIISIECKLNFNLELLSQAYDNRSYFNKSYICVPKKKESNGKSFAEMVCKNYDIGIMEVHDDFGVIIKNEPKEIISNCKIPKLYEEQKNWKSAGGNRGKIFTEFTNTVKNIIIHFDSKNINESTIGELIPNIKHHYKNNTVAKSVILKLIRRKIIKGLTIGSDFMITRNDEFESILTKYKNVDQ